MTQSNSKLRNVFPELDQDKIPNLAETNLTSLTNDFAENESNSNNTLSSEKRISLSTRRVSFASTARVRYVFDILC